MAVYKYAWTNEATGWGMRLWILPHDANLSSANADFHTGADGPVLEVGEQSIEFDELPIGLAKPMTLKVKLKVSALDSTLKGYITQPIDVSGNKTLWMLFSDRGTSGGTYTLEFCGVQSNTDSSKYSRSSGEYVVEYELVDMAYDLLSSVTGEDLCGYVNDDGTDNFGTAFDVDWETPANASDYRYNVSAFQGSSVRPLTWSGIMTDIRLGLSNVMNTKYARTANVGAGVSFTFDELDRLVELPDVAFTLYEVDRTDSRVIGSAFAPASSNVLIPAFVHDSDGNVVGGYCNADDEFGMARHKSAWDWLKDLSENFAVKVALRYSYNSGGGNPYVNVRWVVQRVMDYSVSNRSVATDEWKNDVELEEGASVVVKAEVEFDLEGDNASRAKYEIDGTRTQRGWTLRSILHNLPAAKNELSTKMAGGVSRNDAITRGFPYTNVLYYNASGNMVKIHETLRIYWGGAFGTTYTLVSSALSESPPYASTLTAVTEWCVDMQTTTGIPYGIAKFIATLFGSRYQTAFEVELNTADKTWAIPANICDTVSITGSLASDLSHINWTQIPITGITVDWTAGTSKVKVLSVKEPA